MKYLALLLLTFAMPYELFAQEFRGHEFDIGGKYNILQYRANVRISPGLNSDIIAILSLHDEIEILENTLIEEEINNFPAFWYKIRYKNIEGYTFGGNIAAQTLITDIGNNGIKDYFYLRCYTFYKDDVNREWLWRIVPPFCRFDRLYSNRDIIIYINNRRIETNTIVLSNSYLYGDTNKHRFENCEFINNGNYVIIKLIRYGQDTRDVDIYKVDGSGSIEHAEHIDEWRIYYQEISLTRVATQLYRINLDENMKYIYARINGFENIITRKIAMHR